MESAARPSSSARKAAAAQIDISAVGSEAAARAGSHIRRAKPPPWRRRRRTAQIPPSRRRSKKTTLSHLRPSYYSNHHHPRPNLGSKQHTRPSRRGLIEDSSKRLQVSYLGAKRARTDLLHCPPAPHNNNWRDWANLAHGPAGLIAHRVLAYDVADYVRFRAACRPWRQCTSEPRTHSSGMDRRFHPWRWTMLQEELAAPDRRCFLNASTGECVKVHIPELHDHRLLALTPEGLLVLVHDCKYIRLLNPFTRHLTHLPPLTKLLPPEDHHKLLEDYICFDVEFRAWGSGIANDDSTVVLCFNKLCMIGMAKPGDDSWNLLTYPDGTTMAALMFEGRFCCVNLSGVMVLEMGADQPPHLKLAAKLSMRVSPIADSVHLINNCGELMLVHRRCGRLTARNKSGWRYDTYRVDFDSGKLFPVKSLGGSAVFMGLYCSLSVPLGGFPSGSLSADTIYLRFDIRERMMLKAGAYRLADRSVQLPSSLVPRPHTLIDCLSFSKTVRE